MNEQPTLKGKFDRKLNKNMEIYAIIRHKISNFFKVNKNSKTKEEVEDNGSR